MAQVNSLDSIIHKYKDKLQSQFAVNSSSMDSKSHQTPNFNKHIDQHIFQSSSRQSINPEHLASAILNCPVYQKYSKKLLQKDSTVPELVNSQYYACPINENPYLLNKYKQILDLYYNEIAKNRALTDEIQNLTAKLFEIDKTTKEIEEIRVNEKLEYAQKLEQINKNYTSMNQNISIELSRKVEELERQTWRLRINEDELKRKVKDLEEENMRLSETNREEQYQMSFFRNNADSVRGINRNIHNQSNINRSNSIQQSTCFINLKENYEKLESQYELIVSEKAFLKQQIQQLHQHIQNYKYRINELQQRYYKNKNQSHSPQKSFNKTIRKRIHTESEQSHITSSASSNYPHKEKENSEVERKLKNLEKEYQKLSSQMLTVESAKRIAKQTSKYYLNKQG